MANQLKSEFLDDHYSTKVTPRDVYNLRDVEGRRLSHFWRNGDDLMSVTTKKFSYIIHMFLNPDTYSYKTYKAIKKEMQIRDVYLFMIGSMTIAPLMIYVPFIIPRIKKVRTDYLMHQYLKRKFYEQELKTGSKMMRLRDLKQVLRNYNEKE